MRNYNFTGMGNNQINQDYNRKLAEIRKESQDKINALNEEARKRMQEAQAALLGGQQTNVAQPVENPPLSPDAVPVNMQILAAVGEIRGWLLKLHPELVEEAKVEEPVTTADPVKESKKTKVEPEKK